MKRFFSALLLFTLLFYLFSHPSDAFAAAQSGLHLWFDTLIPTLLPTMIFSNLLIQLDLVQCFVRFLSPITARLLHLSTYGTYALFIGFLCGFPMGAKTIYDLQKNGQLSKEEASYLLPFVNNVSPMFLINIVVFQIIKDSSYLLPTLLIVYGAPIIYGILTNQIYRQKISLADTVYKKQASKIQVHFELIDACIMNAVFTILKLGSYVILFSILSRLIQSFPTPHMFLQSFFVGSMELTNGIAFIDAQSIPFPQKYFFLCMFCVWGGFCALAQTQSVLSSASISIGVYIKARILICFIASLLTCCFLF